MAKKKIKYLHTRADLEARLDEIIAKFMDVDTYEMSPSEVSNTLVDIEGELDDVRNDLRAEY